MQNEINKMNKMQLHNLKEPIEHCLQILNIVNILNINITNRNIVDIYKDCLRSLFNCDSVVIYPVGIRGTISSINATCNEIETWKLLIKHNEYKSLFETSTPNNYSIIGASLFEDDNILAYVLLKGKGCDFFSETSVKYLELINNTASIVIANSIAYLKEKQKSMTDGLLDVYNRNNFYKLVKERISEKEQYCIAMIDFDNFKNINDFYGHLAGDKVLKDTVDIIKRNIRDSVDIIGRYGGEEIIVYLGDINNNEKAIMCRMETICKVIENNPITVGDEQIFVTVSMGISYGIFPNNLEEVINKADILLYEAKRTGKNRCICDFNEG